MILSCRHNASAQPRRAGFHAPSAAALVGPALRRQGLLGSRECRFFDLHPFSHDSFHPFVDPALTMEPGQKRGPSGQFCGN